MSDLGAGTVYTETVVWSPPEQYVNDVPYQLAIVQLEVCSILLLILQFDELVPSRQRCFNHAHTASSFIA